LLQVVDRATPPERKTGPRRSLIGLGATLATALVLGVVLLIRDLGLASPSPAAAELDAESVSPKARPA
jgi:uncharacterized protein involved in exopolysaccharide biosynthesis